MNPPSPVTFVLVGGFLGSGKTTTMLQLGRRLAAAGKRAALITNDQADDLVDTGAAHQLGIPVREIAGGCFCCRFGDLVDRCQEILDAVQPDVLLGEPVGSCADLSATVLQPLKKYYGDWFRVAPYSVLIDPDRLTALAEQPGSPVAYLFGKQLEEADILVLNKAERLDPDERDALLAELRERYPATELVAMSALTGEGLDDWWRRVEAGPWAGERILDIDYDTYADAEAALGWLNATCRLTGPAPFDPGTLARDWLAAIRHGCARTLATIGHIKLLVENDAGANRYSLLAVTAPLEPNGDPPPPTEAATLTLNARVEMPPEDLEALVVRSLRKVCNEQGLTPVIERLTSFRPARPTPTHRLSETVAQRRE